MFIELVLSIFANKLHAQVVPRERFVERKGPTQIACHIADLERTDFEGRQHFVLGKCLANGTI
jgi:hypothetical protein